MFKRVNCGIPHYGGEIVEKLIQSLSAFEIIQERLKRNASPAKNGRASENLGIARDNGLF